MPWSTTNNPDLFRSEAAEFLASQPDLNTMLLSGVDSAESVIRSGGSVPSLTLGWWRGEGEPTTGAFVWSPPGPLVASTLSDAACAALTHLLSSGNPGPGTVMADDTTVDTLTGMWRAATGSAPDTRFRTRLYRLGGLIAPTAAPVGASRVASAGDRDLLLDWCEMFVREAGPLGVNLTTFVDERIHRGGWRLWEVEGEPVAMAARTSTLSGMTRITPVYTLPKHRGRGYGGAVTVDLSAAARESGAEHVLLFTDLANPTSNRLYQKIGYAPVADFRIVDLSPS